MSLTKVKAGNILLTTPSASSNDVTPATTQYVTTALANLADSAPSTLNTLNELAAALGDDANFSTTVTNSIAAKLPLAGGTMTGGLISSGSNTGTNPAANGHIANELQFFNTSATDNNLNGIGFFNSNNSVDARIAGVHKSHSSRHGEIAFLTHDGSALVERMRVGSSGTVLVGKTAEGTATDGIELNRQDVIVATRNGDSPLILNRRTSDGDIALFRKDNSTVGSIGANGGYIYVGSGDTNLRFHAGADAILPANAGGATRSASIDLGTSGAKFKDLHLSGAVSSGSINNFKLLDLGSASMLITHTDRSTGTINSATHNTGFGYAAFNNLTEGDYNVAMGIEALEQNTTGSRNHAFGSYSLSSNVSGNYNTGCGYGTLNQCTASNNTAVGYEALLDSNSGGDNTGIGYRALFNNTSGHSNVVVGYEAMNANQTGDSNTAIGYNALPIATGSDNTAIGYEAGKGVSTGTYNVAVGKNALAHNSGGSTGTFNIAIGYDSLRGLSSGNENVAMGRDAGRKITSGSGNVAIGHEALIKNQTQGGNTMVGFQAGENVTGGSNTMIGYKAGEATEGGVYNIFIGQNTRGTHPSHSQQIAIGYNIDASPGQVAIGTSGMGKVYNEFNTDALWSQGSDVRLKNNITNSTLGLNFINDLRPVTYTWKPSNELPTDFPMYQEENGRDIETIMTGLIAQEVKTAIDTSGVSRFGGWGEDNDGIQQIRAQAFVYPLIKAIQELSAKLDAAEARIATLEG